MAEFNEYASRNIITRDKLEAMGFVENPHTPNIISYHLEDYVDEYIEAYFDYGHSTVPYQINIYAINNSATIGEADHMFFHYLIIAMFFTYADLIPTSEQLRKLFRAMPVSLTCNLTPDSIAFTSIY